MAFTLANLRDDVEEDLRDTSNTYWSTTQVDRGITLALAEYSRASPQLKTASLTGITGREINLSAAAPAGLGTTDYAALIRVLAVEYPIDEWPKTYVRFDVFGAVLTMHVDTELVVEDVDVYYAITHSLGVSGTVPDVDRALLALGAGMHACRQRIAAAVGVLNTDPRLSDQLRAMAADREPLWREGLTRLRKAHGVKSGSLFRPDEPLLSRDVVQMPDF